MAWSTPLTAVANAALTAAQWNASVRDNLLETAVAKATAVGQIFVGTGANTLAARLPVASSIATVEATTSVTYTSLTTFGPQVSSVSSGTFILVGISSKMTQNTNGANALATYDVAGVSTVAASDIVAINRQFAAAGTDTIRMSAVTMQTGLTPGNNIFTMKYRVSAGSTNFDARHLWIIPF